MLWVVTGPFAIGPPTSALCGSSAGCFFVEGTKSILFVTRWPNWKVQLRTAVLRRIPLQLRRFGRCRRRCVLEACLHDAAAGVPCLLRHARSNSGVMPISRSALINVARSMIPSRRWLLLRYQLLLQRIS